MLLPAVVIFMSVATFGTVAVATALDGKATLASAFLHLAFTIHLVCLTKFSLSKGDFNII